jgi:C-terminal processing protease CtpA/Prc
MKTKITTSFIVILNLIFASCASTSSDTNQISDLAKSWVISSYDSKVASLSMISENMSDEGYNIGSRYIGFGFNFEADAMETDGMVVTNVIDGGPASSVLEVGDKFISVNDVIVSKESVDNGSLSFRGKPGVPVNATILRNDNEILITVERGIVEPKYSKEQILQNITNADADSWGENSLGYEIREVVTDLTQRIVYVKTWDKSLDEFSGLEAEAITLTRFEFDKNGKVLTVGNMSENELFLRQTGWSITRK